MIGHIQNNKSHLSSSLQSLHALLTSNGPQKALAEGILLRASFWKSNLSILQDGPELNTDELYHSLADKINLLDGGLLRAEVTKDLGMASLVKGRLKEARE